MKNLTHHFLYLFFIYSCSNYVDQLHKEMDSDSNNAQKEYDKFSIFRYGRSLQQDPISTAEEGVSTSLTKKLLPEIKRKYLPAEQQRLKANDFIDHDNGGSLWSTNNLDHFLFTKNESRKTGDIVVIKVQNNLRKEIVRELNRYFPPPPPPEAPTQEKNIASKDEKKEANPEKKEEEKSSNNDTVFDTISSIISEQINDNYVLLKGKKEILYYGTRRLVQVQALISKKEIESDDSILSQKVLETKVNVLK